VRRLSNSTNCEENAWRVCRFRKSPSGADSGVRKENAHSSFQTLSLPEGVERPLLSSARRASQLGSFSAELFIGPVLLVSMTLEVLVFGCADYEIRLALIFTAFGQQQVLLKGLVALHQTACSRVSEASFTVYIACLALNKKKS